MASIFLTGATGYIGGQVLHQLAGSHPEYAITALIRDSQAAERIADAFPQIKTVVGDLDDSDLIEQEASQASIVLTYWVQVSGASLLAVKELASDSFKPGQASSEVFDDLDDASAIHSLIRENPSRAIDNYILDVANKSPSIKTALFFPPIIYGLGEGPGNKRSVQIPSLAKVTLEKGHGVRVGKGLSRWGNVHIRDLGQMLSAVTEAAANGNKDESLWGENGIYLLGVGKELDFAEISDRVAWAAKERGLIDTPEIEEITKPELMTGLPGGPVFFGSNARSKARRAVELLDWKQVGESLADEIPRVVEEEAKSRA
ncbi:hypothetical protein FZEAL_8575 [Fusarium zealandicum]|uniref:NAD(P)-binding domain-containing protein n=1 Tax=Fusarium zealandicum TaxID=1053134 RepID=A0A8H4UE91_9HYPO|nr:hypothetical protein FZEAL_8575 [Fusarium zealandicum]